MNHLNQNFAISVIVYCCATSTVTLWTSAEKTLATMNSSSSIQKLTITHASDVADNERSESTPLVTNGKLAKKQLPASDSDHHSITLKNSGGDLHFDKRISWPPRQRCRPRKSRAAHENKAKAEGVRIVWQEWQQSQQQYTGIGGNESEQWQSMLTKAYEQGLEDYEEAVARVDKMKEEQQKQHALSGTEAIMSLFDTVSSVWHRVSNESFASHSNVTSNAVGEARGVDAQSRFIQGDPLKGYYDFIITEGSYKFWAGFQLFTAGLMIYSTFAAIYYSKVNPVVGDYDYTSYLGGARSMADDPEPLSSTLSSPLKDLSNSYIFQTAAHGFQFVLDVIEEIPQT